MIDFGKYKGKSFEYVLNELEDYSYLVWMNEIGREIPNHIFNEAFKMHQNELITPSTNELLNGQFIFYIHCCDTFLNVITTHCITVENNTDYEKQKMDIKNQF